MKVRRASLPLRVRDWVARGSLLPFDIRRYDSQCPLHVDASRSGSSTFYIETFATTMRAISGLSLQTPSLQMTKSAGSKTWPLAKSSTARLTFGRSGSN
jgi:hypothetical protein